METHPSIYYCKVNGARPQQGVLFTSGKIESYGKLALMSPVIVTFREKEPKSLITV